MRNDARMGRRGTPAFLPAPRILNGGRVPVQDPVEQEHVPRLPAGRVSMPPPAFRRAPLPGPARLIPPPMRANGRRLMEAREWPSHSISPSPHPRCAFLGARISGGARKAREGRVGGRRRSCQHLHIRFRFDSNRVFRENMQKRFGFSEKTKIEACHADYHKRTLCDAAHDLHREPP